jgi:hypothetical protein
MNAEQLAKLGTIHRDIASDVWPNGAILKCVVCTHTERITSAQAASCLRNGWPSHCDRTMACDSIRVDERYELTPAGRAAIEPTEGA